MKKEISEFFKYKGLGVPTSNRHWFKLYWGKHGEFLVIVYIIVVYTFAFFFQR